MHFFMLPVPVRIPGVRELTHFGNFFKIPAEPRRTCVFAVYFNDVRVFIRSFPDLMSSRGRRLWPWELAAGFWFFRTARNPVAAVSWLQQLVRAAVRYLALAVVPAAPWTQPAATQDSSVDSMSLVHHLSAHPE